MRASSRLALCLLLNLVPQLALAQAAESSDRIVYRWFDAQGQVHYSDSPKAGAEAVRLSRRRDGLQTPSAPAATEQAAADCARQRVELDMYRKSPSLKERNVFGEEREFTPEEREKFLAMKEQELARCGQASNP